MMNDIEKIFRTALEIAIQNGHDTAPATFDQIMFSLEHEPAAEMVYIPVIFSHDFARAFFGEKWRDHLQKMVLEKEPIKYIEQFLMQNYKIIHTETPR